MTYEVNHCDFNSFESIGGVFDVQIAKTSNDVGTANERKSNILSNVSRYHLDRLQCAAVKTNFSLISEPPQKKFSSKTLSARATECGNSPLMAL
jgi:hypothetical protein